MDRGSACTRRYQPGGNVVEGELGVIPDGAEDRTEHEAGEGRHDRYEPTTAEEGEPFRQPDRVVAPVQRRRDQAHHDPAEDTGTQPALGSELVLRVDDGPDVGQRRREHPVADRRGDRRRADVGGEAGGDADREQQRQVPEHGVPGVGHPWDVQQVRLAEAQQDAGRGQDSDGQHQRPTDALQVCDHVLSSSGRRSATTWRFGIAPEPLPAFWG